MIKIYQLIDDNRIILVDAIKRKEVNEKACFEKYGVHPSQFIDYQSLLGDSADNVPGVKGVGKVTAEKLLVKYGSLKNIYDNVDEVTPAGVQNKLKTFEEDAWRSQKLVSLKGDLFDDSFDFTQYLMHEENPFIPIYDELKKYEMNAILRVLHAKKLVNETQTNATSTPTKVEEIATTPKQEFQAILLTNEKELLKIISNITPNDCVAFDTETTGLDVNHDTLVGFSFALNENEGYYVPLKHFYLGVGEQVSETVAKQALKQLITCKLIGHNIKFDLHFITRYLELDNIKVFADTMVLAWLLNSESALGLDKLSQSLLNHSMIAFKETVKKGETFASVELEDACKYAAEDAVITLRLYNKLTKLFNEKECDHILKIAHDVEYPFINTLLSMEREGIRLDAAYMKQFKSDVEISLTELTQHIYKEAGSEFNINSTKQLGVVLFETLGLKVIKKTKTGYSTDEKVLTALVDAHSIVPLLLNYRSLHKLYSTYIDPLLKLAHSDVRSRIYTSFVQTGTATGRLSSKNPNLQNIPTRSKLGVKIREAFVAEEGKVLIGIDYSQIELRLLAHFSKDPTLVAAFNNGKDIHHQTAVALFGEEDAAEKRSVAKTVNFGLLYGMGQKKLSETLKISTKEAKEIIGRYFESFPTVKEYFASIVERTKADGYAQTLLKRRRYFNYATATPMLKAAYDRESVNTVFQGSAADLIKLSMNTIHNVIKDENLHVKMLLQIHDELIFEADEADAPYLAQRFKEIMEGIYTLEIPLKVSVNSGKHWGELK
jgi:DNA polymerase-1